MRKEALCAPRLQAELTAGRQTLRKERSLRFLPCLFNLTDPHAGFSSQNLKPNHVSKINSFDFAKWDGGGVRFLLLSWIALEKMQSKWQLSFPSQQFFWTKRKFFHVKSP